MPRLPHQWTDAKAEQARLQASRERDASEGLREYRPDLQTDPLLLDDVFEVQSQRAFALMRQYGLQLPQRDPEGRRARNERLMRLQALSQMPTEADLATEPTPTAASDAGGDS